MERTGKIELKQNRKAAASYFWYADTMVLILGFELIL